MSVRPLRGEKYARARISSKVDARLCNMHPIASAALSRARARTHTLYRTRLTRASLEAASLPSTWLVTTWPRCILASALLVQIALTLPEEISEDSTASCSLSRALGAPTSTRSSYWVRPAPAPAAPAGSRPRPLPPATVVEIPRVPNAAIRRLAASAMTAAEKGLRGSGVAEVVDADPDM